MSGGSGGGDGVTRRVQRACRLMQRAGKTGSLSSAPYIQFFALFGLGFLWVSFSLSLTHKKF